LGLSFLLELSLIEFRIDRGLVVVVIVMPVVVMVVMAVAMVFAVPVAFMYLPALLVMVVVRMAPVCAGVRRLLPTAGDPGIVAAACAPVPIDPSVAFSRHGRSYLIADWRWWRADIDLDLAECRYCQGRCSDESA
jgi:hypothetical protein